MTQPEMAGARPHWLAPTTGHSTPRVVVTFDTETIPQTVNGREVLTLRCWDAIVTHRAGGAGGEDVSVPWQGEEPGDLVDVLTAACRITGDAWVFAHNAGFDLTVTSLPMILAARGWEPEFVNLGDETCVFVMTGPDGRLTITDSWSWLRCGLDTAAGDVGMRKTRLPDDDDSLAAWHHRCHHDTLILCRLIRQLLDWWDDQQLGRFGVTGSACGWRTMRGRITPRSILVGAEQPRTAMEREAIMGGRKEVFQVGRHRGRWVEDWDLRAAHLTVVANLPLPTMPMRVGWMSPPPDPTVPPAGMGAVCRVRVTTTRPVAPCRIGGEVWWPVGRFTTTLTSPELAYVASTGAQVEVLEEQWYRLGDALQDWGRWCLGLQADPDHVTPRVVKRVAKGWGRAVPGRFALRTNQLISERPATHLGWSLETGHDLDTGAEIEVLTYGGVERTYRRDQDGVDCSPVILAFVEGYVRAAIGRILDQTDPGKVLQVNTDGWWQLRAGRDDVDPAAVAPHPFITVRKATTRDVTVIGPNHTDARGDRRLAGVPKDAERRLDGSFVWQDWPGLRYQLQHSRPGEYVRPGREMLLADHYCRRWVLTSGETIPVATEIGPDGANRLLSWGMTPGRLDDDQLAEWQVSALADLQAQAGPSGRAGPPPAWWPSDGPQLGRRAT